MRQVYVVIIDCQGYILLEVFETLGDEMFDPDWQLQAVDLFLVGQSGENRCPTSILKRPKVSFQHSESHLSLRSGAAHYWIERFCDFIESTEGNSKTTVVFVESESSGISVKKYPHFCSNILLEGFDVLFMFPLVPEEALVAETPTVFILAKHIHKGVHMKSRLFGTDPEHHAGPEDSLGDGDLPVEPAPVEGPCSSDPCGAI